MKSIILMAFTLLLSTSFAENKCSQVESDFATAVQKAFERGLVSKVDVELAKMNEMQAKYACGEVNKKDFCESVAPKASDAVTIVTLAYSVGIRTVSDVITAQKNLREVRALCK